MQHRMHVHRAFTTLAPLNSRCPGVGASTREWQFKFLTDHKNRTVPTPEICSTFRVLHAYAFIAENGIGQHIHVSAAGA